MMSVGLLTALIAIGGIVFGAGKLRREVDGLTSWRVELQTQFSAMTRAMADNTAKSETLSSLLLRVADDLRGVATKHELETVEVRFTERLAALCARTEEAHKRTDDLARKTLSEMQDMRRQFETQQLQLSGVRERIAHIRGGHGKEWARDEAPNLD